MCANFVFKLCIVGDGEVGKTSLRRRFLGEEFKKKHLATLGADFAVKDMQVSCPNGVTHNIKFQIWDLAGQQRFDMVRGQYYLGANGIIAVFDVTRPKTMDNLLLWFNEIKRCVNMDLIYIIVGNKIDLRRSKTRKIVTTLEGKEFVKLNAKKVTSKPVFYVETSAKTGENVEEAFEMMTLELLRERGECYDIN